MSFELIYTSAPRGIKAGTRGYCTVAFTEGMPANYIQQAESLSGYQKPENIQAAPVAYSQYRFVVGGQRLSVLSRVTTATYADYTGRCPTIAHHVLIEQSSVPLDSNPAGVMADSSMFIKEWHDDPHLIRKVKQIPASPAMPFAARQWEKACGDAGWAGILAQSAHELTSKPVYIIFNPESLDPLPLLTESLNLLPPDMRWTVTFNTYFTSLPHGTTCLWRCCLPDSPALREMRATPGALCIDLTKPLGRAPGAGPLVESARTGATPAWPQRAAAFVPPPSSALAAPADRTGKSPITAPQRRAPTPAGVPHPAEISRTNSARLTAPSAPAARKEKKIWPIIVATASVTAVIMVMVVLGFLLMRNLMRKQTILPAPTLAVTSNAVQTAAVPEQPTIQKEPTTLAPPATPTPETAPPKSEPEIVKPPQLAPEDVIMKTSETTSTKTPPSENPAEKAVPPIPPVQPITDMKPEWLNLSSTFKQSPSEVPFNDTAYTNHKHDFYFKDGRCLSPKPELKTSSGVNPKRHTLIKYKIGAANLNIEVDSSKFTFSANTVSLDGITNITDYPVSIRINRKNSGKRDFIIWLQPLTLETPFDQTPSGYKISLSRPALTDCLFGPWSTDNQPWQNTYHIRFRNYNQPLKDNCVAITNDGNKWQLSLTLNPSQIEDIKSTMRRDFAKTRASWKDNHTDPMEYVGYVVGQYRNELKHVANPDYTNIIHCLQDLAKDILNQSIQNLDEKNKQVKNELALCNDWKEMFEEDAPAGGIRTDKMFNELENKIKEQKNYINTIKNGPSKPEEKRTLIDNAQEWISKYETFQDNINVFRNLRQRQACLNEMKACLPKNKYLNAFDFIFNNKGRGKVKMSDIVDFQNIKLSSPFKELVQQRLPNEPDPDNLLMIVDICSKANDVLLSLTQQDKKTKYELGQ